MIASNAVAVTFAEKLIGRYSFVISLFVALSTFGYVNSVLLSKSRIILSAARNNHMPNFFALINIRFLTPIVSVIFMSVATLICLLFPYTFVLLRLNVLAEYLFNAMSVAGLLYLRKIQPNTPRPIKVNLFYPYLLFVYYRSITLLKAYRIHFMFFCNRIRHSCFLAGSKMAKTKISSK